MTESERVIEAGWVTIGDAAKASGYTVVYLRRLARRGTVPSVRVGRQWLVNLEVVMVYRRKMEALGTHKHSPWRENSQRKRKGDV